jgi:predicted AAA+ superfamily ATPase
MTPRFALFTETASKAYPKVHALDSGLMEVFSKLPIGKRVESIVARHLYLLNPGYYHNKWEVDFVIQQNDHILPIEVKFREQIGAQDLAGLNALQAKKPFARAIVVTKNFKGEEDKAAFIPAHLFLALV